MKSDEWHAARRLGIGGSDATIIASGDKDAILRIWREKRGESEPEDLSAVLPVRMGMATEAFNAQWFQERTGHSVICEQLAVVSEEFQFMRCTLDGLVDDGSTEDMMRMPVFEAKHVSAFQKADEPRQKYYAQLQHNMKVTGATKAYLSVFRGTFEWDLHVVEADALYQAQLIEAERRFWDAVQSGEPPVSVEIAAPVEPVKKIDMTGNNSWGVHAHIWTSNRGYARAFDTAAKSLKEMVDPDVMEASGHGVIITRAKTGALTIREAKQ